MDLQEIVDQLVELVSREMDYRPDVHEAISNYANSVTFIKMIVNAEKTFGVKFADDELNVGRFSTLQQVAETIAAKIQSL